jgi:predicted RNA-binding Zn-ribbon protein involved in translation (DUF1610 family)
MANEPEPNLESGKIDEKDEPAPVDDMPRCPNCGWHNVRPSMTKGSLDLLLSAFSFKAFRCRSCGHRFHTFRRAAGP